LNGLGHTTQSLMAVHLDFEIGRGLTALVGGDGPQRREVLDGLAGKLARGDARMVSLIAGHGVATPALAWRRTLRLLAEWSGLNGMKRQVDGLPFGTSQPHANSMFVDSGIDNLQAVAQDLPSLPEPFRFKGADLNELRAYEAEAIRDIEVANMEWFRERQDAETHLLAYRDRVRELKVQLQELESGGPETACPFCNRVLDNRFESVSTALREEWESIVQDGSWWKRRKDQLDEKPLELEELEGKLIRIQAASEEYTEEVERVRIRFSEWADAEDLPVATRESVSSGDDVSDSTESRRDLFGRQRRALEVLHDELLADARRTLILTTGRYLNHLTSGVVLGVGFTGDDEPMVVRDEGSRTLQSDEEIAAYMFALRLAFIHLAHECEVRCEEVLLDDTFDRLEPEAKVRAVGLLRSFLPVVPKIILFCRGEILDAIPESFDWIVELGILGSRNPRPRVRKSGVGKLQIN